MASAPITPASAVPATNTWTALGVAVPALKVEGASIRVTNVGSVDCNAKLRINNGSTIINRAGQFAVPAGTQDAVVDLEDRTPLPAGWYWECWASAGTNLEFSKTGWQDDA